MNNIIYLTPEEAKLLYNPIIDIECPFRYYTDARKVWWAIIDIGSRNSLPYTICQDCYHNNRFGYNYDPNIKDQLVPILTTNIRCNCDGRTIEESYQIKINNEWSLGIYTLNPKVNTVNMYYNNNNSMATAYIPFNKSKYVLCLNANITIPNNNVYPNPIIICELTSPIDNSFKLEEIWGVNNNTITISMKDILVNQKKKNFTFVKEINKSKLEDNEIFIDQIRLVVRLYNNLGILGINNYEHPIELLNILIQLKPSDQESFLENNDDISCHIDI